jgi:AdoMet-dependent heme synthase
MQNKKIETLASGSYDELEEKACAKNIPVYAQLELTYKCNLKCLHCYTDNSIQKNEMSTKEIKHVIDQLAELNTLYLVLTGGEIFTRPDWFEIAAYARIKGFALRLYTNATLITAAIANKIYNLKPLVVETSLYGSSPEVHEMITQIPGSFDSTIIAIKQLVKLGVKVLIKTMVIKNNISEIIQIQELTEELGAGFRSDPVLMPKSDGSKDPLEYRIDTNDLFWYFKNIISKWEIKNSNPDKSICNAGKGVMLINPYGEVFPCIRIPQKAGDLRKQSLHKTWTQSSVLQEIRDLTLSKVPECAACKDEIYCITCPGLVLFEHDNMYLPATECCRQAKVRRAALT